MTQRKLIEHVLNRATRDAVGKMIVEKICERAAEATFREEYAEFLNGEGTNKPNGIMKGQK